MSIQYSGGTNVNDLYTGVSLQATALTDINTSLVSAGWTSETLNAFTVLSLTSGNAVNTETVTLNGLVYTFKTVINNAAAREVAIGGTSAETLNNFASAVNAGAGSGTAYSSATVANPYVTAGKSGPGISAYYYSIPGTAFVNISQITAGVSLGYTVSETLTNGSFSTATINWYGYKLTSAMTPAGLACKTFFWYAADSNVEIRCAASNTDESSISNSFASGETLFGNAGVSADIRVIANKYQCFVIADGAAGNITSAFWYVGVPWIPDTLTGEQITSATNASPIVITTSTAHGLTTANQVVIRGVIGNTAANVTNNAVTVLSATTFELDGTTGNGSWTSGGYVGLAGNQIVECIVSQGTGSSGNLFFNKMTGVVFFTCLNGSRTKDGGSSPGVPGLATVISAAGGVTTELTWFNQTYLVTEPLLTVGTSAVAPGRIAGQFYDMVVVRQAETMAIHNPPGSMDSHNWWNLTDNDTGSGGGNFLGSCWHVIP